MNELQKRAKALEEIKEDLSNVYGVKPVIIEAVLNVYFNRFYDTFGDTPQLDKALINACDDAKALYELCNK